MKLVRALAFGCLILAVAGATSAALPPPPDPAAAAAFERESCPPGPEVVWSGLTVRRETVTPKDLRASNGKIGKLTFVSGVKLYSDDARLSGVTGLLTDRDYGLVAVTDRKDWLVFDFEDDDPAKRTVRVTPIVGANSPPHGLLLGGYLDVFAVGYPEEGVVLSYYQRSCRLAARGVPVLKLKSPARLSAMAITDYSYGIFLGRMPDGTLRDTSRYVDRSNAESTELDERNAPRMKGHELVAMAGTTRIVPLGLLALWRPVNGKAETVIQQVDFPQFSHVRVGNERTVTKTLARIPMALESITGFYDQEEGKTHLIVASRARPGEPTTILSFTYQP